MDIKIIKDVVASAQKQIAEKGDVVLEKIPLEEILFKAMKLPLVKINREAFLRTELNGKCSEKQIQIAIDKNPAFAGIERSVIDPIAKQVINYETNKVSAISFAAGIPGGFAMLGTIPADITQFFGFILRVMQQLAYLYGFDQFNLNEDEVNVDTMNHVMVFLGVMFGVQSANAGVKFLAQAAAQKVSKSLAQKALTKGTIYPIVKKIAQTIGVRMTKQIFANGVSKVVPVIGGVVTGGLTYAAFKPSAKRLRKSFTSLNLCNPEYYKNPDSYSGSAISEDNTEETAETDE